MQNPLYDEMDLTSRVSSGDEAAFRELVRHYFDRLSRFVMNITGSRPLTEELVQDILLKVWEQRTTLQGIEKFGPWLFVVARNHTYNAMGRIAREKMKHDRWAQEVREELERPQDPEKETRYADLLEKAIEQLPPQQRMIYLLSRRDGLSTEAIRERTGLAVDTIKKHRSLAIRNIKKHLVNFLLFFFV